MSFCSACPLGKSHKLPFHRSFRTSLRPLDLIHSDVWGPSPVSSNKGFRFYVSFVDDFSKYTWFFPMTHKSEVFPIFKKFKLHVETFFERKLKAIQTDWGGEYRTVSKFMDSCGVFHRLSCPHTQEQNGSAERKHRHIVETGLTMMARASVPFSYWDDGFTSAVFLIN